MTGGSFARPPDAWYAQRLACPPAGAVLPVVIDTDAANEIDDQFAIAWALRSPHRLDVRGLYAAPFSFAHRRGQLPGAPADAPPFNPPEAGMERSRDEIVRVRGLLGLAPEQGVFRGYPGYLPAHGVPASCEATDHLIATARAMPPGEPLYVVALGCPTNVAAALLLAPDIAARIVVVWTSGFPSHAPHVNASFNLEQDLRASRVLVDSGVPLVYLPGYHVGAQLRLSRAEADRWLPRRGAIGGYLHRLFAHNPLWTVYPPPPDEAYSWVIWDLICIAWLLEPGWVPSTLVATPGLGDDLRWIARQASHPMREAHAVDRDAIFRDLFARL
jgi:inosine-uridine nucleoside N-ribohydrolase